MCRFELLTHEAFREVTLARFDFLREFGFQPCHDPKKDTSITSTIAFIGKHVAIVATLDIKVDHADVGVYPVKGGHVVGLHDGGRVFYLTQLIPNPGFKLRSNSQMRIDIRKARKKREKQTPTEYLNALYDSDIEVIHKYGQRLLKDPENFFGAEQ